MKKSLKFMFIGILGIILPSTVLATTAPTFDDTYNTFYANGTAIKIEAPTYNVAELTADDIVRNICGASYNEACTSVNADAVIVYGEKYSYVSDKTTIFGGSKGASVTSSSITMNGGTVGDIFGGGMGTYTKDDSIVYTAANVDTVTINVTGGESWSVNGGGYLKSTVKNVTINMTGGLTENLQGGGYAGTQSYIDGTAVQFHCGTEAKPEDSLNRTNNVVINVTGGRVTTGSYGLIFGGGLGFAYVGTVEINIGGTFGQDGDYTYVTAGGANGRTDSATVNFTAGTIGVYQGVNRGSIGKAVFNMTGGTVEDAVYAGGETGDSSVTGVINESTVVNIAGGTVPSLLPGKSGGTVIPVNSTLMTVFFNPDAINNEANIESLFGTSAVAYVDEGLVLINSEEETISEEKLQAAVETGTRLVFTNADETYSIEIKGENITDPTIEVNTNVTISEEAPAAIADELEAIVPESADALFIDFEHSGALPGKATVYIDVSDKYEVGTKIYITHYNEATDKLEWIAETTVQQGNYITFDITTCSTYVATTTALVENPNTFDGIYIYAIIAIIAMLGIGFTVTKIKQYN